MSYGLEIYDIDGTTKVLSPNMRFGVLIDSATNVTLDTNTPHIDFVMSMAGVTASTVSIIEISSGWSNAGDYSNRFEFLSDRIRINAPSVTFYGDIYILRF
jgi:hypothetical protein